MQTFNYNVSVVIPVCNAKEHLNECIKSIMQQQYNFNKIEIILVNYGSADSSSAICKDYSDRYPNIKNINLTNTNVFAARNSGIRVASGKYIMFVNSNDTISTNTIGDLFDFFEKHYDDIRIATYPVTYNNNGIISNHPRYDAFNNGTNIYDINKHIYLLQSNINIIIKNEFQDTPLYSTQIESFGDQNYNTELIMKTAKTGYVETAMYYCRRNNTNVPITKNNPYYCFEDTIGYNEMLLEKYNVDNKIPKYVQSLCMNTIKWKLRSNELFPYYLEGAEWEHANHRIKNIINEIDTDIIINFPGMNLYHKIHALKLSGREIVTKFEDALNVYCEDQLVYTTEQIEGFISRIKLRNSTLSLMADLFNPAFDSQEPEVYIEKTTISGKKITEQLPIQMSNESYRLAMVKVTNAYGIDISFDITNVTKFKIYVVIDGHKVDTVFTFKKFASNNFIADGKNVLYSKNTLCFRIRKATFANSLRSRLRNCKDAFSADKKTISYRLLYYLNFNKKNIWIYTDNGNALGNAYTQFVHDFKKNDGITRYYICKPALRNKKGLFNSSELSNIIIQGSRKHKILFLRCDKIITSFIDLQVYCPFNKSIKRYNDLTKYELVYLQHGMLHADLRKMYSKEFTEIDKFVVSSTFEVENLTSKYNYKQDDLILSGMPRMNAEVIDTKPKNKILLAPSWRKYLIGNLVNNQRQLMKDDLLGSIFFKEIYSFLHSDELKELLEKENYTLDFRLHPNFKAYSDLFDLPAGDNVTLNTDDTPLGEYKIFITDFSSFQFDFVKMKRSIVYFLPDVKEFKAGLHTYMTLDLKYEDAFGKLCLTAEELLAELKHIISNDCNMDAVYKDRMDKFFLPIDDPCAMIYDAIITK